MLTSAHIATAVSAALLEDAPWGDITVETLIPGDATACATLVAREPGVLSGIEVFAAAFRLTDARIHVERHAADGDVFAPGQTLATVTGPARSASSARCRAGRREKRGCAWRWRRGWRGCPRA